MATRYIETFGASAGDAATHLTLLKGEAGGNVNPVLFDAVDGVLKYYDRVAAVVKQIANLNQGIVSATATLAVTNALHVGRTVVLNAAAGFVTTLPAATGSGDKYRFVVGTLLTSSTLVVQVTGDDVMYGGISINNTGDTGAATVDFYPTAADSDTITLTASVGAGKIGDFIEVEDIAADVWAVHGVLQGEADPVTPFSAAV